MIISDSILENLIVSDKRAISRQTRKWHFKEMNRGRKSRIPRPIWYQSSFIIISFTCISLLPHAPSWKFNEPDTTSRYFDTSVAHTVFSMRVSHEYVRTVNCKSYLITFSRVQKISHSNFALSINFPLFLMESLNGNTFIVVSISNRKDSRILFYIWEKNWWHKSEFYLNSQECF